MIDHIDSIFKNLYRYLVLSKTTYDKATREAYKMTDIPGKFYLCNICVDISDNTDSGSKYPIFRSESRLRRHLQEKHTITQFIENIMDSTDITEMDEKKLREFDSIIIENDQDE